MAGEMRMRSRDGVAAPTSAALRLVASPTLAWLAMACRSATGRGRRHFVADAPLTRAASLARLCQSPSLVASTGISADGLVASRHATSSRFRDRGPSRAPPRRLQRVHVSAPPFDMHRSPRHGVSRRHGCQLIVNREVTFPTTRPARTCIILSSLKRVRDGAA